MTKNDWRIILGSSAVGAAIVLFVLLVVWVFITFEERTMKCPHCDGWVIYKSRTGTYAELKGKMITGDSEYYLEPIPPPTSEER